MTTQAFGNDPAKVARYEAYWNRDPVARPLVAFSLKTWFPLREFAASSQWESQDVLTPDMVDPEAFMEDQERLLLEGETMDDDALRGACPSQAIPWLDGIMGSRLRILPGNALGEEQHLPWEKLTGFRLDHGHPWYETYMNFAETLVRRSDGRFPVSHGCLHGPTDMLASLRGHGQSVVDLLDEPETCRDALWRFAYLFEEITAEVWKRLPLFHGGYFDAQYQLWTRGPIIRMQEDAIAVYSPDLYREFVQPIDRYLAGQFSRSFMHLHSTSMFLLDLILEIEELRCLQVNYEVDSGGPDIYGMLPYFQEIQRADRTLLVRASFTPDELRALMDGLDPRGLYLYLMVDDMQEVETLRPIVGM